MGNLVMGSVVLRVIGCALIIAGLTLVSNPELVSNKPIPSDTFQAIERRIWWGVLIGLGCLPLFHRQLRPWVPTLAATLSSLVFGMLVARLIGILLDGSVAKQWLLLGVEAAVLTPFVWWYLKVRT